ncbi:hypothetical protein [Aeoliella mucimassa]|uniref:PEP-CTERM protein-sorting domain-containing protein n=1 Tax=Aeoliella mucimassa TaxID=2527972 RepID=A0A518AN15_9BACT|nr:hypothetical protein [Aeoliella mucimassa]QDU56110.1 hypothetical protein Pan181_23140 [Aeoliella mucimassa]
MLQTLIMIASISLLASTAEAHRMSHNSFGGRSGGGGGFVNLGGRSHHGDFGVGGTFGFDIVHVDEPQTKYESIFDTLVEQYETDLTEIDDYYTTDDYSEILDNMEWLVVNYDLFLSSVERSIERLDDVLGIANEDLTYYTDLLTEYEANTELSEDTLERIIERLTAAQERITEQIETLTNTQTTLNDNLATYTTFADEIGTYLDEMLAAGGTSSDDTSTDTSDSDDTGSEESAIVSAVAATSPYEAAPAHVVPEPASYFTAIAGAMCLLGISRAARRKSS